MILTLTEYKPAFYEPEEIPRELARELYESYGKKVEVLEPSFQTNGRWRLTSQGVVGFIPLSGDSGVALRPKVPVGNLFRMLEYAYRLELLSGFYDAESIEELYERLASLLALRVLDLGRKGLARAYERESEHLPYVRGRLDVVHASRRSWATKALCHYEEHTADTEDNRILAWTLHTIARGALRSDETRRIVRQAYRQLAGVVTIEPVAAARCVGRRYDRLNESYRPLHALCRFFLENSGPTHRAGDRRMLPFVVDMARLFEAFVAEWLRRNLPPEWRLEAQETMTVSKQAGLTFAFDLVLYERTTNRAVAVLDTKYKAPDSPAEADVHQVQTYAAAKGCDRAYLVYPTSLRRPLDEQIGPTRVRTVAFEISNDLEEAGRTFLDEMLSDLGNADGAEQGGSTL